MHMWEMSLKAGMFTVRYKSKISPKNEVCCPSVKMSYTNGNINFQADQKETTFITCQIYL